jgi:hypothetical protein
MKKRLPDNENTNLLNTGRVYARFTTLKKKYKELFFDLKKTDEEKQEIFPFYAKMNEIFVNYAIQNLNASMNMTLDDIDTSDISHFMLKILEDTDENSNDRNTVELEHVEKVTETQKVKDKLAVISPGSIKIIKQNMRYEQNTPFNRRVSNATILKQKNDLMENSHLSSKRKLTNLYPVESNINNNKKMINAHSSKRESDINFYQYEALDECDLSEILHGQSKKSMPSQSTLSSTSAVQSTMFKANADNGIKNSTQIRQSVQSESKINATKDVEESVLEIPELPEFSDGDENDSTIQPLRCAVTIPKFTNLKVIKLPPSYPSNDINNVITPNSSTHDAEAPMWFKKFLNRYENDMKLLKEQLKCKCNQ